MDAQGRKAEISLALGKTLVFLPSTLIPPPAWADRLCNLLSCCFIAWLSAHILLPDFRKKTLCLIYIKRTGSYSQPTGLLLSPWQMALAPATRGTGAGELGGWRQNPTTDLLKHPCVAINEGRSSCPCPNHWSPATEHNCTAECLKGDGFCFTEVGSR